MKYKLKSRNRWGEIKTDFFSRTKKAFSITPQERGTISKSIKKVPPLFKTYSNRIDFGNLYGHPLKRQPIKKKIKHKKKQQYIVVRIKK
jgi:hypothetical protein